MVDVAHDRDDRRTRREIDVDVGRVEQAFLDVGFGDALDRVAHLFRDELRRISVDDVVDLMHLALLHQQADDVDRALRHAVREFLNGDRLGKDHLAQNLFLLLHLAAEQPLLTALEGGDGARALFVGSGRGGGNRQPAAIFHRAAARGGRARRSGRREAADGAHGRTSHRGGFALGANGRAGAGRTRRGGPDGTARRCNAGGVTGQPATRFFLGLAFRLGFARETLFFLALARVGGGALGVLALLAFVARLGVDFRAAAIVLFARFRIDERAGARLALLIGQRAQHDARAGARRRRRTLCLGSRRGLRRRRRRLRNRGRRAGRLRRLDMSGRAALHLLDHDHF